MTKRKAELFSSPPIKPKSVAIIGGGIASICTAEQILTTQPDTHIDLFCVDNEIATRGSSNKQGAIYPLLQAKHSILASLYAKAYHFAKPYYQRLHKQGIEFEHAWCGVLQQAYNEQIENKFNKIHDLWKESCELISAEESSLIAGLELPYKSLFYKDGGWLWPQQVCQNTIKHLARRFNLTCHLNRQVTDIQRRNSNQWRLTVGSDISKDFDAVVICCGHLANQFSQSLHIPIEPIRGQVSRLHSESSISGLKTVLCHSGYITPSQGQYQCFGATFERNNLSEESKTVDDIYNLNQLQYTYSQTYWAKLLSNKDIIGNNAAIRATSIDHSPIVGELFSDIWVKNNVDQNNGLLKRKDKINYYNENDERDYQPNPYMGLFLFTGLGARGLTTAPLMAEHLTCLLFGLESKLTEQQMASIAPIRFQVRNLKRNKSRTMQHNEDKQ